MKTHLKFTGRNNEIAYIPIEYLRGCVFTKFKDIEYWEITEATKRNRDSLHWLVKESPLELLEGGGK